MDIKSTTYRLSLKTGEIVEQTNHRAKRGIADKNLLGVMTEAELKELKEKGVVWTELKTSFLHVVKRYEIIKEAK